MRARAIERRESKAAARLSDLFELTKPGITAMVVVTAGIGFLLGAGASFPPVLLLHALLGTGLVAAGASTLNHVVERDTDALMRRTAGRPLPAGRLDPELALLFGVVLALVGLVQLALAVNLLTALLGASAFTGYVFVYTPLKRVTSLATLIGAVPGALPPVMGWAAIRDGIDPGAWVLFGILFLWQLPHFLAIAWLCRRDYAQAGFPMITVLDPSGSRTARQMVLYGAALLPVSILPSILGLTGIPYLLGALALGLVFFGFCIAFSFSSTARAARHLLLVSVIYLPAVLAVMVLDRVI